jgi:hypothetical protein
VTLLACDWKITYNFGVRKYPRTLAAATENLRRTVAFRGPFAERNLPLWKQRHILFFFYYYYFNIGIQASLRASRLIPWILKLTTM